MKARDGLRMVLGEARARGAEEGRLDAAERARHAPVRRTRVERGEPVKAGDWWLVARTARAIGEMDDYGFGEEEDDVHVA